MPGRFATQTDVPAQTTRNEIERLIEKYGGDRIIWSLGQTYSSLIFDLQGWHIRYDLPLPDQNDRAYTLTETGRKRTSATNVRLAWEQGVRQRWRALKLILLANFEAIELGITTVERAFLAQVMLPSRETVADRMLPMLHQIAESGDLPPLLPEPGHFDDSR